MDTWEYEIVIGNAAEVREQLNRLGALGWMITSTNALAGPGGTPTLIVYLERSTDPDVVESNGGSKGDHPRFRPHN